MFLFRIYYYIYIFSSIFETLVDLIEKSTMI